MNKYEVIYFGCYGGQTGHYIRSKLNPNLRYSETPWGNQLDGGMFPGNGCGYADGFVHISRKDGWTGIAIADNSIDSRPGSHSTFVTAHDITGEKLLEFAKSQWPEVFNRGKFPKQLTIVPEPDLIP